jgi:hypothetical protein
MAKKEMTLAEILQQPIVSAERPKPFPTGSYVCAVQSYDTGEIASGTEYIDFTLKPVKAMRDVDKDALKEVGGLGDRTLRYRMWGTSASSFRLRNFIENCGVDFNEKTPFERGLRACINQQVVAHVTHNPSADGEIFYANVKSTAPIPDED